MFILWLCFRYHVFNISVFIQTKKNECLVIVTLDGTCVHIVIYHVLCIMCPREHLAELQVFGMGNSNFNKSVRAHSSRRRESYHRQKNSTIEITIVSG